MTGASLSQPASIEIYKYNGTVIQAPLANSTFVNGGEQAPWPGDTTTTITPYQPLLQT
jgi:hypothetical protein